MKKISLKNLSGAEILSTRELKQIMGGVVDPGGGTGCAKDSLGLCGGNCATSTGAAAKCGGSKSCTCGG